MSGALALAQQPQQQPIRLQPGLQGVPPRGGTVTIGPDGKPRIMPAQGTRRPGAPGMPGMPGMPAPGAGTRPHARPDNHVVEPEEELEAGEHECPGHGADDPPPHVNLWHGLLGVDNVRSLQPGMNQILFRYEDLKHPCDPKNEPPPYLASLINFAVLAFVLFHFGRKPLADSLLARKNAITAEIDTATRLKDDAEARLADYEEKIDNIQVTLDEIRTEYAVQAETEKKHVLVEAEERRVRMRRDAEFRIEQERKQAREELLHEAVVNATAAAEVLIQKQMSASDQDRMANAYLTSVVKSLSDANEVRA